MLIGDGSCTGADAVDEGACGCRGGVFGGGDLDRFAGAAVGHLSGGLVRGAGSDGLAVLCGGGGFGDAVGLVEEGRVFESEIERAFGSVEPELVAHLGVVGHGGEDEATSAGVGEDGLNVVVGLAAIVVGADGAGGDGRGGGGAEDPVGDVHVVGAQFGEQTERPLVVEAPVDQAFERGVGDGAAPVVVAVPVGEDVGDVAYFALLDTGDCGANPGRVTILVADL